MVASRILIISIIDWSLSLFFNRILPSYFLLYDQPIPCNERIQTKNLFFCTTTRRDFDISHLIKLCCENMIISFMNYYELLEPSSSDSHFTRSSVSSPKPVIQRNPILDETNFRNILLNIKWDMIPHR